MLTLFDPLVLYKHITQVFAYFNIVQFQPTSLYDRAQHKSLIFTSELVEWQWGVGSRIIVADVKNMIADILREYVDSGDISEAWHLSVALFHHEVVKRALILKMEAYPLIGQRFEFIE